MQELIRAKDTTNFIELSKKKYKDTYTYDETKYRGEFMNIYFNCIAHNKRIRVKPFFHLNSSKGCKECSRKFKNINI